MDNNKITKIQELGKITQIIIDSIGNSTDPKDQRRLKSCNALIRIIEHGTMGDIYRVVKKDDFMSILHFIGVPENRLEEFYNGVLEEVREECEKKGEVLEIYEEILRKATKRNPFLKIICTDTEIVVSELLRARKKEERKAKKDKKEPNKDDEGEEK